MRARWMVSALCATLLGTSACNAVSNGDCIAIGVVGLTVTVVDASTQAAPSSVPSLEVTDGSFQESYATPNVGGTIPTFAAATERPGVYTIVVRAAGYRTFTQADIAVTRGGSCNTIQGVKIKAPLIAVAN
jgi:hypothetical protein